MYQTKFDLFSGSITNLADDVVAVDLFGELSTTPWIYTPQIAKEFVFAGDLHQPRARLLRLVAGIPCKLGNRSERHQTCLFRCAAISFGCVI